MMDYEYGNWMMQGGYGGFFGVASQIIWFGVGVLLLVWLWQQVNKK